MVPDHKAGAKAKRNKKTPPIYNRTRGDKKLAMATARDPAAMEEAMNTYTKDWASAGDTTDSYLQTWYDLHMPTRMGC